MLRTETIGLSRGIDVNSYPYQLFLKAKRFGVWNPSDIDFSKDKEDWKKLTPVQQESMRMRFSRFCNGEESVTMDILPLLLTVAKEGRLEEELFLTTFLFEEAKHTEFFQIVLTEIGERQDLTSYIPEGNKKLFWDMLPTTMNRLLDDPSPQNVAEAAALYNLFAEGVLAETGYFGFYEGVNKLGLMPGLIEGITLLKKDESRHIAFGTYLLQRLISENPELYDFVEEKMKEWMPIAEQLGMAYANADRVDPFGVSVGDMLDFQKKQLNARMEILRKARTQDIAEIGLI